MVGGIGVDACDAVVAVGGRFVGAFSGITNCVGVGGRAVADGASVGSSINSATGMKGALQASAERNRVKSAMRFIF